MLEKTTVGLWCRSDKTWYYLESGVASQLNATARIQSALIAKGKIVYDPTGTKLNEEPFKVMTYAEALEKEYKVKPIFLNPHIKKIHEQKQQSAAKKTPWE